MSYFIRLPVSVEGAVLPKVPSRDVQRLVPEGEYGCYGHWIFDRGVDSLVDIVNERSLTQVGSVVEWNNEYVAIGQTNGNALRSDWLDAANQTQVVVFSRFGGGQLVIAGTRATGEAGSSLYMGAGPTPAATAVAVATTPANSPAPIDIGLPNEGGGWHFAALSESNAPAAGDTTNILFADGQSTTVTGADKSTHNGGVGVGNLRTVQSSTGRRLYVAEYIVFPYGLTSQELSAVYERSKKRMRERGIMVA